jgi:hypothetical protein
VTGSIEPISRQSSSSSAPAIATGTRVSGIAQGHEVQGEIIDLIGPLSTFLQAAENHWLRRRPDGVVNWP